MIGSDLLRFSSRKILVMDLETQRVNTLVDNLPFQCSWIVTQKGRILERHNHYMKWPNFKMSAGAAMITRFQQSWVDNGEDPRKVLAKWESMAMSDEYLIAGHNFMGFDGRVWRLWREALGMKPDWSFQNRVLDTHLLSKAHLMGIKPDRTNLRGWQRKMMTVWDKNIKTSLTAMTKQLEIPIDETRTHDGMYDIELTSAVLWKLINLMEI